MASTCKKKTEKVKKFSLCLRSGNINPLMQAFGQTFEITVNTIFHYLPFTRARWRRRTALAKIRGKKRLVQTGRRGGERGVSAQHVEGVGKQDVPKNCGSPNSTIIKEFKVQLFNKTRKTSAHLLANIINAEPQIPTDKFLDDCLFV